MCYAHTLSGSPPEEWQSLWEHLSGVSRLASRFAEKISAGEWGRIAGLLHDVGKYSKAFQDYIGTCSSEDHHAAERQGRVDHSSAGAQFAANCLGAKGKLLAYCIAGHHAGLADGIANDRKCLEARLANKKILPAAEYHRHVRVPPPNTCLLRW